MSDRARCLECLAEHDVDALEPFQDVLDLEPGDEIPAGRCPANVPDEDEPDEDAMCGAQCLLVDGHYWRFVEEHERKQTHQSPKPIHPLDPKAITEADEQGGGVPGTCDAVAHGFPGQVFRVHPWSVISWNSAPESMGDGNTYGWRGTCSRCGTSVIEWLVCDGAEEVGT